MFEFLEKSNVILNTKKARASLINIKRLYYLTSDRRMESKQEFYNTPRKQHKKNQYLIPKELKYKDYFKG